MKYIQLRGRTGARPPDNIDLDYSLTWAIWQSDAKLQFEVVGY
jgi:hypothetical protein